MITDASSDLIQESLTANNKNLDLNNNIISNEVLSPTQKHLTSEMKHTNVSENNVTTKGSLKTLAVTPDLPELDGNVTAVVANVKYTATDS
jgi:hypothetical protein